MPYLDKDGLTTLWAKVKATFALKSHSHVDDDVETTYDGTYIASGETVGDSLLSLDTAIENAGHAKIWTGTCATGASTAAKVVTLDDAAGFPSTLVAGTRIAVTFTNTNTVATVTLTIQDSSGTQLAAAKTCACINYNGGYTTNWNEDFRYGKWAAYETVLFTFTGTYWIHDTAPRSAYGAYYGSQAYNMRGYTTSASVANNSTNYPVLFQTVGSNVSSVYSNSNVYVKQGTATGNTADVRLYAPNVAITGTPTNDTDAATKGYVDEAIASGGGSGGAVSGVKGNAETSYRTGQVNLTPANIGAAASSHTHAAGDITSGTLSVARGGTGYTTLQATRSAMGLGNTTGAVPIANGGTGQTTVAAARNALGLGNTSGAVPIANGGTGATTAANARSNLGITCSNLGIGDYVTSQGTTTVDSVAWRWRKWNSGWREAWCSIYRSTNTYYEDDNWKYAVMTNGVSYPSGLFTSAPRLIGNTRGAYFSSGVIFSGVGTAAKMPDFYLYRPTSYTGLVFYVDIYVSGT